MLQSLHRAARPRSDSASSAGTALPHKRTCLDVPEPEYQHHHLSRCSSPSLAAFSATDVECDFRVIEPSGEYSRLSAVNRESPVVLTDGQAIAHAAAEQQQQENVPPSNVPDTATAVAAAKPISADLSGEHVYTQPKAPERGSSRAELEKALQAASARMRVALK